MNFYFLLFDKFETLDLFGPVEIFGRIPDARLNYISTKGGIITSAQGTQILTKKHPNCQMTRYWWFLAVGARGHW